MTTQGFGFGHVSMLGHVHPSAAGLSPPTSLAGALNLILFVPKVAHQPPPVFWQALPVMQATLQLQAAAPASACRRPQQTRCPAVASMAPKQQHAVGASAPKVGLASQRAVAAQANIQPMEATFTEFNLTDKTKKVRSRAGGE